MAMSKDYATRMHPNIIIFKKQAQMINSLYSCGYEGAENPRLIPSQQPGGDPDLHPDLSPKPGRLMAGLRHEGLVGGQAPSWREQAAGDGSRCYRQRRSSPGGA
jgi:hypothetical protein